MSIWLDNLQLKWWWWKQCRAKPIEWQCREVYVEPHSRYATTMWSCCSILEISSMQTEFWEEIESQSPGQSHPSLNFFPYALWWSDVDTPLYLAPFLACRTACDWPTCIYDSAKEMVSEFTKNVRSEPTRKPTQCCTVLWYMSGIVFHQFGEFWIWT